ncbi:hypothetical protein EDC04DRAFT_2555826 [Pisolithus marmoratus]|nr:hypothetical protein EDC04DRAFT_2555826 [Pisolithus marmoratus]
MFSEPAPTAFVMSRSDLHKDPFVSYSRSIHDYTLRLWTESRRVAEEKARNKDACGGVEDVSQRRKQPQSCSPPSQSPTTHS